jgi:hypothetical protein
MVGEMSPILGAVSDITQTYPDHPKQLLLMEDVYYTTAWWLSLPLGKMMDFVNWDHYIFPTEWKVIKCHGSKPLQPGMFRVHPPNHYKIYK